MNKADLVDELHKVQGSTRIAAEQGMEALLNAITETLKRGDEVSIAGLGIF